ncbi:MAG: lactonase family protein [Sphingomonadales bacterium]|nr:MAG: lactonase family protein [Sphingomonadales bacterium]
MIFTISRRTFVTVAALAVALPASAQQAPKTELVYIGTQANEAGQGIVAARFDPRIGALTAIGTAAEIARPTWVATSASEPLLYAVSETGTDAKNPGKVMAFAIKSDGALEALGDVSSGGGGPTHLALDAASKMLFAAHYSSGHVAAFPLRANGSLGPLTSVQVNIGSGPSPRQKSAHAHGLTLDPSGRFLAVADLGADRVFFYRFDRKTRALSPGTTMTVPAGHGPRHLVFHPRGNLLFLMTELVPEIRSYRWDARRGEATLVQAIQTRGETTEPKVSGAEIAATADGRFVYVSNRGEDVIVGYAIDAKTGTLREIDRVRTGKTPWSFAIHHSGKWVFVANQGANSVSVFRRDIRTGKLSATDQSITVGKPTSIAFAR